MTAKAALIQHLLEGRVLNVKNVFSNIGLTNCAREIPRMIEHPFGVEVSRVKMEGESRYKQKVTYTNYRLNKTERNKPGIEKMKAYLQKEIVR
jgi:hypothetical protein